VDLPFRFAEKSALKSMFRAYATIGVQELEIDEISAVDGPTEPGQLEFRVPFRRW
jgi:hypothetical protein